MPCADEKGQAGTAVGKDNFLSYAHTSVAGHGPGVPGDREGHGDGVPGAEADRGGQACRPGLCVMRRDGWPSEGGQVPRIRP